MFRPFYSLLLLLAFFPPPAHAAPRVIDDFETGLAPGWTVKEFKGLTTYAVVADGGGKVLRAESRGTASGLVYAIDYAPADYPVLAWRWKVANIIPQGDETVKSGDDYAARVYVVFPHWLFFKTRSINYIWANKLPKEAFLPNAFTGNAVMLAVESGPGRVGEWIGERRNIVDDYRRFFGEEPPAVGAIAIMTDTDQTGSTATAWFDDIRIEQ
ncbi:MAG: hypothetical protein A2091_04265 [Desulfuromonadales bacterium GWD2_61_12]|nr:MAG: hypothetical protein A2005_08915 [Desulfuromonadales bacterium GWC2_61_20]OGR36455.1 MAG: hypothetical protein A2091_04265 [Desulfuromonadales bacterium GWD2_61_12]HAD05097.1 hypothetical protein [Desulfuromonas sp.]